MNLPNKLTVFRMILIVPFVLLLLGGFHEWAWFTAIFGGIMEYVDYIALAIFIIASLTDLSGGNGQNSGMDCHYHHQPRIHHQRFPSGGIRQGCGYCRQLLGQIQDHLPDDYGLFNDCQY